MKNICMLLLIVSISSAVYCTGIKDMLGINMAYYSYNDIQKRVCDEYINEGIFNYYRVFNEWQSIENQAALFIGEDKIYKENLQIYSEIKTELKEIMKKENTVYVNKIYIKMLERYSNLVNSSFEVEIASVNEEGLLMSNRDGENKEERYHTIEKENGVFVKKYYIDNINNNSSYKWNFQIISKINNGLFRVVFRKINSIDNLRNVEYDYDFGKFEKMVDKISEKNGRIVAGIGYAHRYHLKDIKKPPLHENTKNAPELEAWEKYTRAIVKRYKNKIKFWQIWNEPNHVFWGGTFDEFVEVYKCAAKIIREEDPGAVLVFSGTANTNEEINSYYEKVKKAGLLNYIDIISHHAYTEEPEININLEKVSNFAKQNNKELWITEIGWSTGKDKSDLSVSEEMQSEKTLKTIPVLLGKGIKKVFLYEFADKQDNVFEKEANFGMIKYDGSEKEVLRMLKNEIQYFSGFHFMNKLNILNDKNIFAYLFSNGKRNRMIIWCRNAYARIINIDEITDKTVKVFDLDLQEKKLFGNKLTIFSKPIYIEY